MYSLVCVGGNIAGALGRLPSLAQRLCGADADVAKIRGGRVLDHQGRYARRYWLSWRAMGITIIYLGLMVLGYLSYHHLFTHQTPLLLHDLLFPPLECVNAFATIEKGVRKFYLYYIQRLEH